MAKNLYEMGIAIPDIRIEQDFNKRAKAKLNDLENLSEGLSS